MWIGYAVYGFAFAPWGLIAIAPQAIILGSILGVTGIPPTENQAIRSKGDAYRAYQKRVSRFVPMPPKARGGAIARRKLHDRIALVPRDLAHEAFAGWLILTFAIALLRESIVDKARARDDGAAPRARA